MATVLVTVVLPTLASDGVTPWPAADYGGADIFRADNGGASTAVGTILAPALTFSDATVPSPDSAVYTADVFDTSAIPLVSALSAPFSLTIAAAQPVPGAPSVTAVQTA